MEERRWIGHRQIQNVCAAMFTAYFVSSTLLFHPHTCRSETQWIRVRRWNELWICARVHEQWAHQAHRAQAHKTPAKQRKELSGGDYLIAACALFSSHKVVSLAVSALPASSPPPTCTSFRLSIESTNGFFVYGIPSPVESICNILYNLDKLLFLTNTQLTITFNINLFGHSAFIIWILLI